MTFYFCKASLQPLYNTIVITFALSYWNIHVTRNSLVTISTIFMTLTTYKCYKVDYLFFFFFLFSPLLPA